MSKNTSLIFLLITLTSILTACPNSDQLCTQCESTKCAECRKSLKDSTGKCIAITTEISNCLEYQSETQCKRCEDRYTLDSKKKCFKISIENCSSLKTFETCRSCANSMMPSEDGKKCTDTLCSIKNCDLCFKDGTNVSCQRCLNGYVRSSDKIECKVVSDSTQNCFTLDIEGKCEECLDGYYMSDGKCLVSSAYTFDGFVAGSFAKPFTVGLFYFIFIAFSG